MDHSWTVYVRAGTKHRHHTPQGGAQGEVVRKTGCFLHLLNHLGIRGWGDDALAACSEPVMAPGRTLPLPPQLYFISCRKPASEEDLNVSARASATSPGTNLP